MATRTRDDVGGILNRGEVRFGGMSGIQKHSQLVHITHSWSNHAITRLQSHMLPIQTAQVNVNVAIFVSGRTHDFFSGKSSAEWH